MINYPDISIQKFLLDQLTVARPFVLESTIERQAPSADGRDRGKQWLLFFKFPDSDVKIKVWLHWPNKRVFLTFHKGDSWFSFPDYLAYIGKKSEYYKPYQRRQAQDDDNSNSIEVVQSIELILEHLDTSLAKVASGEEWIDVPIDYDGYK